MNIKKSVKIICGITAAVFIVSGCAKQEIKNVGSKGTCIVCFGDSITLGYGSTPQKNYPSYLGKLVTIPVINAGIDGDTTVDALIRMEEDVLSENPRLVIIEFGGNDFLKKIPISRTLQNLETMIDIAHSKGAMVALVDISAGMFFGEYRSAYAKIAQKKNVIFIPSILKGIITNPSFKSDFLHPNEAGYELVAQRIYRVISPFLEQPIPS